MKNIKLIVSLLVIFFLVIIATEVLLSPFFSPEDSYQIYSKEFTNKLDKKDHKTKPRGYLLKQITPYAAEEKQPHPYFGYVYAPNRKSGFNYDGFRHEKDYFKKEVNTFVVGIFGGSVADQFAMFIKKEIDPSLSFKIENMSKKFFDGKEVKIFNFGVSSYRQPQQFFVSAAYEKKLDLAINIDGYNEVVPDRPGGYPNYFPKYSSIFFDKDGSDKIKKIASYSYRRIFLTNWISESKIFSKSNIVYLFWKTYVKYLVRQENRLYADYDKPVKLKKYPQPRNELDKCKESVGIWEEFTEKQFVVQRASGVKSLFVVQPVQYLKGSKIFSSLEKDNFLDFSKRNNFIGKCYERYDSAIARLKKKGIPILDARYIFEKVRTTVYSDSCCHLNSNGNKMLRASILQKLIQDVL